jgi:hypothetical protein
VADQYVLNTVNKGWEVELFLNGQPAAGGADYHDLVTTCVIDGRNTVRIVARPTPGKLAPTPCLVQFAKVPLGAAWDKGQVLRTLNDDDTPDQPVSTDFEFTARVPFRWVWQDAQDVGELTDEDKQQIFAIMHRLEELFRQRDWRGVKRLCAGSVAGAESGMIIDKTGNTCWDLFEKMETDISGYGDYAVFALKQDDVALATGSKIVRLHPKRSEDKHLIVAGHALEHEAHVGEMTARLFFDEMRFVRIDNQWYWIM